MSVVAEFSLPPDGFALGAALSSDVDVEVALEAVVPTSGGRVPFVWARGGDLDAFERGARADEAVSNVTLVERLGDDALFRIDWSPESRGLLAALADHDAVVLEATRLRRWRFRVRFHDHEHLPEFYEYCVERDVDLSVTRVAVLDEPSGFGFGFGLPSSEREALALAVEEGYFEDPRQTDLPSIATDLGLSRETTSNRIRRGVDRVLRATLHGHGSRYRP